MRASESGTTTFRVINTDMLGFLVILDHRGDVRTCPSNRKTFAAGVVIPYGGLTDTLNTRRFPSLKLLTVSRPASSGREGRESLLAVDTDGTRGSCWQGGCQLVSVKCQMTGARNRDGKGRLR